jgi:aspartate/tyrosine/aromatic aminotransferase
MFQLDLAPADPILGLTETFKADTHPDKINLGVGVYQDATGKTPILKAVTQAETRLLETETSKSYLSIPGVPEVATYTQELLLVQVMQSSKKAARRLHKPQAGPVHYALLLTSSYALLQKQLSGFRTQVGQTIRRSSKPLDSL